jgi:hypothetical protein
MSLIKTCYYPVVLLGEKVAYITILSGELDNGRGSARLNMFRHLHEVKSGRTSSLSHEILGFDAQVGNVHFIISISAVGDLLSDCSFGRKLTTKILLACLIVQNTKPNDFSTKAHRWIVSANGNQRLNLPSEARRSSR